VENDPEAANVAVRTAHRRCVGCATRTKFRSLRRRLTSPRMTSRSRPDGVVKGAGASGDLGAALCVGAG
jgi:hypothetical protein